MIRAIIFDFFGVFRTDGYNQWISRHDFDRRTFLRFTQKHDRGEYSEKEFFRAIADAAKLGIHGVVFTGVPDLKSRIEEITANR